MDYEFPSVKLTIANYEWFNPRSKENYGISRKDLSRSHKDFLRELQRSLGYLILILLSDSRTNLLKISEESSPRSRPRNQREFCHGIYRKNFNLICIEKRKKQFQRQSCLKKNSTGLNVILLKCRFNCTIRFFLNLLKAIFCLT